MKNFTQIILYCVLIMISAAGYAIADGSKELQRLKEHADDAEETLSSIDRAAQKAGKAFDSIKNIFNSKHRENDVKSVETSESKDSLDDDDDDENIDEEKDDDDDDDDDIPNRKNLKPKKTNLNNSVNYRYPTYYQNYNDQHSKYNYGLITANTLNLRRAPTTNSHIVSKLYNNELVEILREHNGWLRIRTQNNIKGWVFSQFVSKIKQ